MLKEKTVLFETVYHKNQFVEDICKHQGQFEAKIKWLEYRKNQIYVETISTGYEIRFRNVRRILHSEKKNGPQTYCTIRHLYFS